MQLSGGESGSWLLLENYLLNAGGAETLLATVHLMGYITEDSRQCLRTGERTGYLVKEVHSQLQNTSFNSF